MRRIWKIAVILVPALIIAAAAAAALWGQRFSAYLTPVVQSELTRALDREVRVGSISGSLARGAVLHDLRIAEGRNLQQGVLLSARRVLVGYRLRGMLFGKAKAAAITGIEVVGADLKLTRDPAGRWNIASLLRLKVRPAGRLTAPISVTDSVITLTDYRAPAPIKRPLRMRLVGVNGRVTMSPEQGAIFRLQAAAAPSGVQHLAATGSSAGDEVVLEVRASGVELKDWGRRLALRSLRVSDGTAQVKVTGAVVRRNQKRVFDYVAHAQVQGARLRVAGIGEDLRAIAGPFEIAGDQVRLLGVRGAVGSGTFAASGTIVGFKQPQFDLQVKVEGLDAAAASRLANVRLPAGLQASPIGLDLAVRGGVAHPIAAGRVRVGRVQLRQMVAQNVTAQVVYREGTVWGRQAQLKTVGGDISGNVWVRIRGGEAEAAFEGQGRKLDLGAVLAAADVKPMRPISGSLNGSVAGAYDAQGWHAAGSFEARNGSVGDIAFTSAGGVARLERGELTIASARIESPAGTAVVAGTIAPGGALALEVRAGNVDLARVARLVGIKQSVSGAGYFTGTVSGSISDPEAAGVIEVLDAQAGAYGFDLVSGAVTISRRSVAAQNLLAYQRGGRYLLSGAVTGLQGPREGIAITGHMAIQYAQLSDLLAQAGISAPVQGEVEAVFDVGGTLGAPTAAGSVVWLRPQWKGGAAERAEAKFDFSGGVVRLSDARVQAGDSQLTAAGEISPVGDLRLTFAADVRCSDLLALKPVSLPLDASGRLTASGEVAGMLRQPRITAQARADKLSINGETFSDFTARVSPAPESAAPTAAAAGGASAPKPERLQLELSFAQDQSRYSVSGWTDLATRELGLQAAVAGGSLARLRSLFQATTQRCPPRSMLCRLGQRVARLPSPVRGNLDLQAALVGSWRKPAADINFHVTDAFLADAPMPDVVAGIGIGGNVVHIHRFEARQGAAYAAASGTVDLSGALALQVDGYNLHAGLLDPWSREERRISGSADLFASVSGTVQRPQVVGSLEVADLAAGGVQVDHLRIPRFELRGDVLAMDEVVAALGPHVIHAAATLPVSWRPLRIDAQRPLSATVDLTGQDLGLLSRVAPVFAQASGALGAHVQVGGTWQHPQLTGSAAISGGALALAGSQTRVTGLEGAIRLEGQRVVLEKMTGRMGPGAFAASGEMGVATLRPADLMTNRFDLKLAGTGLAVDLSPLFEGALDVDLALTGPEQGATRATLHGGVLLTSGNIGLPQRGVLRPLQGIPLFDPRLDLQVSFSPNLWLRTPTMSMQVSGAGHIGGRLSAPAATATVESRRGTVDLPAAHFRVTYASMEATVSPPRRTRPGLPQVAEVRAIIRLDAETNLRGYKVNLSMSGPLTDPKAEPTVELTSVPALDEQRLWALVTGLPIGPVTSAFGSSAGAWLTRGLGGVALYPVERALARAFGLQEFGVVYSEFEPMRIRVGGYVFRRLYGTYVRSLTSPTARTVTSTVPEWDVTLTYEVLPALSLGAGINERNQILWEGQTTWRF